MKPAAHEILKARPWLGLIVTIPVALVLLSLAYGQFRRARAFGQAPQPTSTEQALRSAAAGIEPWVELNGAELDCSTSVVMGSDRYARVRARQRLVPLVVHLDGASCPSSARALRGVVKPMNDRLLANLKRLGLGGANPSDFLLSTIDGPSNAIALSLVCAVGAGIVVFLGCIGYLIRRYDLDLTPHRGGTKRPLVLEALHRPPLRLRTGYVLKQRATSAFLVICGVGFAALTGAGIRWLRETALEPERFARASPVSSWVPARLGTEPQFLFAPRLCPEVTVTWQRSADEEAESLSYHPLWEASVKSPIEVREDAAGFLTSAGLDLRVWRMAMWGLLIVVGAPMSAISVGAVLAQRKKSRAVRRMLERPVVGRFTLVELEVERQYGLPANIQCKWRDGGGLLRSTRFHVKQPPLRDDSGTLVFGVSAADEPSAEPILLAEDGYPFVIGS